MRSRWHLVVITSFIASPQHRAEEPVGEAPRAATAALARCLAPCLASWHASPDVSLARSADQLLWDGQHGMVLEPCACESSLEIYKAVQRARRGIPV